MQLPLPLSSPSTNIDLETGIRYGVATNIDDDFLVNEVMMRGVDVVMEENYQEWKQEQLATHEEYEIDEQEFFDNYCNDYARYEYSRGGLHLIASNLNGYFQVTVLKSPHVIHCALCSPCCPNAGDLNTPDENGFATYALPHSLMRE